MAGYYKYQRKRGDTGNDVMRALTAARKRMRAAGIPAVRDEAEDHYYVLEWSLTAAQRTLFLSQLSADRHASDACLKHLTGASDVTRRGSFAPAPTFSDARTQLFKTAWGSSRRSWCTTRRTATAGQQGQRPRPGRRTNLPTSPTRPPRHHTETGWPWCCASKPNTRRAGLPRTSPHLGTTGPQSDQKRSATQPRSRNARPPRRASGAHLHSSRHRETSRIGSAGTTARTPPTLTGPRGLPARAPSGCPTAPAAPARPTMDGAGPGPAPPTPPPYPTHRRRGEGGGAAALVGGRRDIMLATTEAAGGGDARPGGDKSSRSDYASSGHGGGSYPPTTATNPAACGRVAATAGLPIAVDVGTGRPGLDDVEFGSGVAPS